jgi:hypothetical protein
MYEKSSKRIKETIIPKIEEIKTVSGIKPKKEIK